MKHLFVYGSLKPGGHFYPRLEPYVVDSQTAFIQGELYDTGNGWPAVKLDDNDLWQVEGVMYSINDEDWDIVLSHLDLIEGYPKLFDRKVVDVWVVGSSFYEIALVYFGNDERLFKTPIRSGVWEI